MKLSNIYNLPEALVNAIKYDCHRKQGQYSVTELISPPRIVQLTRRHDAELEEDVSDRIWLLLGKAVHYVLEKGAGKGEMAELLLAGEVNGIEFSGTIDLLGKTLWDYKVTSVWTIVYHPQGRDDWHAQVNIYNWLCGESGANLDGLKVCAILRDWDKRKARTDRDYPQIPVAIIDIPRWTANSTRAYLEERINKHRIVEQLDDTALPPCTPEEIWEQPTRYAVMRGNNKRADRVFGTIQEAASYCGASQYIEERTSKKTRCLDYCSVWEFCDVGREVHGL